MIPFPLLNKINKNIIPPKDDTRIKKIVSADRNTMILTDTGDLWVTGQNSRGTLGVGDSNTHYDKWTKSTTNVEDVWIGVSGAVHRKKDQTYYRTGTDRLVGADASQLQTTWLNITSLLSVVNGAITDIVINTGMVILTAGGNIYGIGYNNNGSLGTGNLNENVTSPKFLMNQTVKKIFGSYLNTYFITTSNVIYGCGLNSHGQLNSKVAVGGSLLSFTTIEGNVANGACWYSGLIIQRANGDFYSCGSQNLGQLGNGLTVANSIPSLAYINLQMPPARTDMIGYNTNIGQSGPILIEKNAEGSGGRIHRCGDNSSCAIGDGTKTNRPRFTLGSYVNTGLSYNDYAKVTGYATDWDRTYFVYDNKTLYACGVSPTSPLPDNINTLTTFTKITLPF